MSKIRIHLNYSVVATLVKGIRSFKNEPERMESWLHKLETLLDKALQEEVATWKTKD